MAIPQQKFREIVFQMLFSYDFGLPFDEEALVALLMQELAATKKNVKEALNKVRAIWIRKEAIDAAISAVSMSYSFDRIQAAERNILRLGAYEILFDLHTPPKVAINEAVRLAKKFSTPAAMAFINALLDAIYKKKEGIAIDEKSLQESIEAMEVTDQAVKESLLQDED